MLVVAFDRGEAQLGAHEELLAAAELLDLPDDGAFLGRVVHAADVGAEARRVGVFGDGDEDLDVVGRGAAFELGAGLFCCWSVSAGFEVFVGGCWGKGSTNEVKGVPGMGVQVDDTCEMSG